jgi:hypothetical protein
MPPKTVESIPIFKLRNANGNKACKTLTILLTHQKKIKMICIDCVTPEPLKKLISGQGTNQTCEYCGEDAIAIKHNILFDSILKLIDENTATEDDLSSYEYGMLFDCGSDEISIATLDVVLSEWMNLDKESYFNDLYEYAPKEFKTNIRNMDRHYFGDEGMLEKNFYEERWGKFIDDIRHSHRFFNPNAKEFLDSVFAFLSIDNLLKPECVRTISKGIPLYRARSASTYEEIKKIADDPASQLGPTPKDRASNQRMTPNGISALYCALERETCLSEIRSITGDNVVSVAMTPTNELRLLDLTKLELVEPPQLTLLDNGYRNALHLKTFISTLVKKMSKPKGRNDDLSYLSTQVVFEYLRLRFGSQVNGLVFPSVQTGEQGTNVVLFPEVSIVSAKNFRNSPKHISVKTEKHDDEEPFEDGAMLYCLPNSLRFHKVKAIETKADEYTQIGELFISDLNRKRLGISEH